MGGGVEVRKSYIKLLNWSLKVSIFTIFVVLLSFSKISPTTVFAESIGSDLKMGQNLRVGQSITSSNGQYYAVIQKDGNFVVYDKNKRPIWATATSVNVLSDGYRIAMQTDGNLVLYNQDNNAKWATQTEQDNALSFKLTLGDDGILKLFRESLCIWSSDSGKIMSVGNNLQCGQALSVGQYLQSSNGIYTAKMQQDGRLVIYDKSGTVKWTSDTNAAAISGYYRASMQMDGNLVIYSKGWNPKWASNTGQSSSASFVLNLRDDGVLQILRNNQLIWNNISGKNISVGNQLQVGQMMASGQYMLSSNGLYQAKLTSNGVLALYNSSGNIIWKTNTDSNATNDYRLSMQKDGNLVLYNASNRASWATSTDQSSAASFVLKLEDDGGLRLYRNSQCIWNNTDGTILSLGNQITTGQILSKNQYLISSNGNYTARIQSNGNFSLFDKNNNVLWSSGVNDDISAYYRLYLQGDGNLVLYKNDNTPKWATATEQPSGVNYTLKVTDDGDLTLLNGDVLVWDSNRGKVGNLGNEVGMERIWTNQYLQSANGNYSAHLEQDGNFVVYAKDGSKRWSTNSSSSDSFTDYRLSIQTDGNLVIYGLNNSVKWASNTDQAQGSQFSLRLEDDGDLKLLKDNNKVWSSDRGKVGSQGSTLNMGTSMWTDQYLQSDNKIYTAKMQQDGNFVVYGQNGAVKWASNTGNDGSFNDYRIGIQPDGNLVIHGQGGTAIWASNTDQAQGAQISLVLSNYGDLRILKNGDCIWDTNASVLGVLSAKYESNGDPGAIGNTPGDPGGKSYGAWQLASKVGSVDSFIIWLKNANYNYYQQLLNAKNADGGTFGDNFDSTWKNLATTDRDTFLQLQHDYIKSAYYDSAVKSIRSKYNVDITSRSFALQNVLWSTAVQHGVGGAANIFGAVNSKVNLNSDDETVINAVYDERSNVDKYFSASSDAVKAAVKNRFVYERADALKMLHNEYVALDR